MEKTETAAGKMGVFLENTRLLGTAFGIVLFPPKTGAGSKQGKRKILKRSPF